jgi:hypothetical protein
VVRAVAARQQAETEDGFVERQGRRQVADGKIHVVALVARRFFENWLHHGFPYPATRGRPRSMRPLGGEGPQPAQAGEVSISVDSSACCRALNILWSDRAGLFLRAAGRHNAGDVTESRKPKQVVGTGQAKSAVERSAKRTPAER